VRGYTNKVSKRSVRRKQNNACIFLYIKENSDVQKFSNGAPFDQHETSCIYNSKQNGIYTNINEKLQYKQ